jgi:hypothetical protein
VRILLTALVLLVALPVGQLRLSYAAKSCCCADASKCKCPDHKPSSGKEPSMRACHKTQHDVVSPEMPAFQAPVATNVDAPVRNADTVDFALAQPHVPPVLRRARGPS